MTDEYDNRMKEIVKYDIEYFKQNYSYQLMSVEFEVSTSLWGRKILLVRCSEYLPELSTILTKRDYELSRITIENEKLLIIYSKP